MGKGKYSLKLTPFIVCYMYSTFIENADDGKFCKFVITNILNGLKIIH